MIPLHESETPKVAAAVVPLRYQAATIIAKTLGGARMSGPMLDVRVTGGTPEAMVNYAVRQFLRNPHTVESWHEAGKMLQLAQQMKINWDESLLRPAHRKVMDLGESTNKQSITIQQFVEFVCAELKMTEPKSIKITDDLGEIKRLAGKDSFGLYDTKAESVITYRGNRHPADVLRTLAHELVHHKQMLSKKNMDGADGSDVENEANAQAGVLMRKFSQLHPNVTRQDLIEGVVCEVLGPENEWGTKSLVDKYKKATPGQSGKRFRIISKESVGPISPVTPVAATRNPRRQPDPNVCRDCGHPWAKHTNDGCGFQTHTDPTGQYPEFCSCEKTRTQHEAIDPRQEADVVRAHTKLYGTPKKKDPAVTPPPPSPALQSIHRVAPMIEALIDGM